MRAKLKTFYVGVVKLGDFGLSTTLSSTVAYAQTQCGTPFYFSPELCRSEVPPNHARPLCSFAPHLPTSSSPTPFPFLLKWLEMLEAIHDAFFSVEDMKNHYVSSRKSRHTTKHDFSPLFSPTESGD